MGEKLSKNLQVNLFITFVTGILGFVSNKYFAKIMGLEMLGLMKLFTQLIGYLSLADLGIASASTYALYKPLKEKNISKINSIISTIDNFYKKIASIIFIIGAGMVFVIPYIINLENYQKKIYIYWLLYVVNTSVGYIFAKYSILFTANQEFGFLKKVQGLVKIIIQIFQISIIIKTQSFTLFILLMILENILCYYLYHKKYKKNYFYIEKVKNRDYEIIKNMKNLFWHKIGTLIVYNTDYIILSKFISLSTVGIYSSYLIIYQMVVTLLNVLTAVLTPKIGFFIVENNQEKIYKYWKGLYSIYFYISAMVIICSYYLIEPFIILWLGEEFLLNKISLILILINLFIHLITGITEVFKINCGFFDDIYVPILESILNLFFSLLLVQKMGLNGVIIGTTISNVLILLLLKPMFVFKRCFNKNPVLYIYDSLKFFSLLGIGYYIINIIINIMKYDIKNINNWENFVYKSIVLGVISSLILLILFLFDKSFRIQILKIRLK